MDGQEKLANIRCPHLVDSRCTLVEKLIGHSPVRATIPVCIACQQTDRPNRLNFVTLSLATRTSEREQIMFSPIAAAQAIEGRRKGLGTKLQSYFGILFKPLPDCKCEGHKDILDVWTAEYIRHNLDKVVDWLAEESSKRNIPFSYALTRLLLKSLL